MGWMKSGSTRWAGHPSPSRLFPVSPWRKLDVRVQETLLCRYQLHRRCTLWRLSFGGGAFLKHCPSPLVGGGGKLFGPCVFSVVAVLRLNAFSVFGLRRSTAVPCI